MAITRDNDLSSCVKYNGKVRFDHVNQQYNCSCGVQWFEGSVKPPCAEDQVIAPTVTMTKEELAKLYPDNKWTMRFMDLAYLASSWSKDPKRKVGAALVSPDARQFSLGYNGLPAGIDDSEERLNGWQKNHWSAHAELNAILNARRDLTGHSLFVTMTPCKECCIAIIQAGIKEVFCPSVEEDSKWYTSCKEGSLLLKEAGIEQNFV